MNLRVSDSLLRFHWVNAISAPSAECACCALPYGSIAGLQNLSSLPAVVLRCPNRLLDGIVPDAQSVRRAHEVCSLTASGNATR